MAKTTCQNCGQIFKAKGTKQKFCSVTCKNVKLGSLISRHGMYKSVVYSRWLGMLDRCRNPKNKRYADYGGRGITVDERWQTFENFYADMGDPPSSKHSIERIENSKGYSKDNCKWATAYDQQNNTRRNVNITYNGKTANLKQWAKILRINYCVLQTRIKRGWPIERAFTEGVHTKLPDGGLLHDKGITVSQAAKILNCTTDQVRLLADKGFLKSERSQNGFRIFKREDVEEFAQHVKWERQENGTPYLRRQDPTTGEYLPLTLEIAETILSRRNEC